MDCPEKQWVEEARRLIANGTPVQLAARQLGKSEYAVRFNLDINNFRARRKAEESRRDRRKTPVEPKPLSPETIKRRQYDHTSAPAVPGGKVTLPAVSILASAEPEPTRTIRFAPKTYCRAEPAGVAAIRAVHQRMIRAGKIAQPTILSEMHS
jgi:hypothetical protein